MSLFAGFGEEDLRKNGMSKWKNKVFGGSTFLHNTKPLSFWELKNCIGEEFWKVYMNSSNLFYVDIIFLKLKI